MKVIKEIPDHTTHPKNKCAGGAVRGTIAVSQKKEADIKKIRVTQLYR